MKLYTASILMMALAIGCGDDNGVEVSAADQETDTYRAALVGADDVEMSFEQGNTRTSALSGEVSGIAALTASAVVHTNVFIVAHLGMMKAISDLPPTATEPNARIWEGEHEGNFLRVRIEKSDTPRGTRFDYSLTGRPADEATAEMMPLIDGDVVRIETRPAELGRQGFGLLRFHFDNINELKPEEGIAGTARIAFRRVGGVRQVHARMLGVHGPNDRDFTEAAEYAYTQLPNDGGAMKWFSIGDVQKDGEPYEKVSVHSMWRGDHSGMGSGYVFGGSLDVDYWRVRECWDARLLKGYEALAVPGMQVTDGDVATCFGQPDDLELPEYQDTLPNVDPELPAAHPEESAE